MFQANLKLSALRAFRPPFSSSSSVKVVDFDGKKYKVNIKQYESCERQRQVWTVIWMLAAVFLFGVTGLTYFQWQAWWVLLLGCLCLSGLSTKLIVLRQFIMDSVLYSVLNFATYLWTAAVLTFCDQKVTVATIFYSLVEILLGCYFMKVKGHLMGKMLFIGQFVLIVLKLQGRIEDSWKQILTLIVALFVFVLLCLFLMSMHFCFMIINRNNDRNRFQWKIYGAILTYISVMGLEMALGTPLLYAFLDTPLQIPCFISGLWFGCVGLYTVEKKKEIVLFFCRLDELSQNQNIYAQQILHEKNTLSQNEKKHKCMVFYRHSDNWFSIEKKDSKTALLTRENPQKQADVKGKVLVSECIICMATKAEIIWVPCGHLNTCSECLIKLFFNKNLKCPLCKSFPTQIHRIQNSQEFQDDSVSTQIQVCLSDRDSGLNLDRINEGFPSKEAFEIIIQ